MDKDYMRKSQDSDAGSDLAVPPKPATTKGFRGQELKCLPVLGLRLMYNFFPMRKVKIFLSTIS